MKKILLITTLLLTLVGCASASIEAPSNNELFSINGKVYTEADVFNSMHLSTGALQVVRLEAQSVLLNTLVEEDSNFQTQLDEMLAEVKESIGDNFDIFLKENGFETEAQYVDEILKDSVKLNILLAQVMSDDYEALKVKRPREVRIVELDADKAEAALAAAKSGTSLEDVAEEFGRTAATNRGNITLVSELSTLDTGPLNVLLNATEVGLFEEIIPASTGSVKYLVEVVNLDADVLKDAAIEVFVQDQTLSNQYLSELFIKHEFTLYDQSLNDRFKENYPDYIK